MRLLKMNLAPGLICLFLSLPTVAMARTWALGLVVGDPTGLSANYSFTEVETLHTTLDYEFSADDRLEIASHYTWRKKNPKLDKMQLGWFYGAGARLVIRDRDHHQSDHKHDFNDGHADFGPSGTVGLYHQFKQAPLEIFLKGNLTVNIIEDTDVDGDVMLGLHYNI
jgi:hypothetical protein